MKESISKRATAKVGASRPLPFMRLAEQARSSIDSEGNWLITLSDLLSLLLVCFVVFFALTKNSGKPVSAEVGKAGQPPAPNRTAGYQNAVIGETILHEMNAEIRKHKLEGDVSVHAIDKEIVITMKERVTFRPGEALTLESSKPMLDNIAHVIHKHDAFQVEIEGHTDNVPIKTLLYPSNWELSVARAASVLKYFIHDHGIAPSRLSIKGSADQKPVAENDSAYNRARNRRVEIRLKTKDV